MTLDVFTLSGRVALVTGAGSPDGIGFATARILGGLGARVAGQQQAPVGELGVRLVDD